MYKNFGSVRILYFLIRSAILRPKLNFILNFSVPVASHYENSLWNYKLDLYIYYLVCKNKGIEVRSKR